MFGIFAPRTNFVTRPGRGTFAGAPALLLLSLGNQRKEVKIRQLKSNNQKQTKVHAAQLRKASAGLNSSVFIPIRYPILRRNPPCSQFHRIAQVVTAVAIDCNLLGINQLANMREAFALQQIKSSFRGVERSILATFFKNLRNSRMLRLQLVYKRNFRVCLRGKLEGGHIGTNPDERSSESRTYLITSLEKDFATFF